MVESSSTLQPSHPTTAPAQVKNLGWRVTLAGLGINLALGVLYSWSVVSGGVPDAWGWSQFHKNLPYSVACLIFSVVMVGAGRMQDRLGPRLVASLGGLLVGGGLILASFSTSPLGYVVGFGLLAGAGFGFGYASATPPAVKWFPPARTGLIAGLVVSGFGLASVYIAPLTQWLIGRFGLASAVLILGFAFLVIVTGLAQLLQPPPAGYVPPGTPARPLTAGPQRREDYRPREMLGTWQFYVLWFMFACGAGAGLMIIAIIVKLSKQFSQAAAADGVQWGFLLVAALAVGNGAGRIIAGMLSDRIGRKMTLLIAFVFQALMLVWLSQMTSGAATANFGLLAAVAAMIGANYGANLSLFPSVTKDFYGLKNFGVNYGLVFTAWGLGGFVLALVSGIVYDRTSSFQFAYYGSAALLVAAALVTLILKAPHHVEHELA